MSLLNATDVTVIRTGVGSFSLSRGIACGIERT